MEYIINNTLFILKGATITLKLYIITAIICVPLSLTFAITKAYKIKIFNIILGLYTWVFRGTPLLLQLFFIYYGLPIVGISFSPFASATIAFTLNYTAYLTEIFRAGIESIDKGQYEAAFALGLNYRQTMLNIILPQAIRRIIPPACNEAINLIKDTALIASIGMGDLLRASKEILTRDFTITPFIIAGVLYLIISSVLVIGFKYIEKRYALYN